MHVEKCARTCVHKFLSPVFHTHTPDSSPARHLPLQTASPLSPAAPTRYVLEPTQVASAVHQLPRTSVPDLREEKTSVRGETARRGGGCRARGLTPPRRGGRVSVLETQVPLAEGGARAFRVSDALSHPPPTFVLSPLPLGSGWGRSLLPPLWLQGRMGARPSPRARRLGAAPCGRRDGDATRFSRSGNPSLERVRAVSPEIRRDGRSPAIANIFLNSLFLVY